MSAEADATPGFGVLPSRSEPLPPASPAALPDELLIRAQAGDEIAFADLYRITQPRLLRYLRVLIGPGRAEAEDIAAETWFQVCRDLAGFRGGGDEFLAWVVTVGRNRAIDQFRRDGRRPSVPVPVEEFVPVAAADDTEHQALTGISTGAAIALIGSLPPDQAEAVMLRAVLGLDAKSAGRVLGKRPGAVRTAAYRGLKTLAGRLPDGAAE